MALLNVHFTPPADIAAVVIAALQNAQTSVLVLAYDFTSAPIAAALKSAHARGVDVEIVADGSPANSNNARFDEMAAAGIPIYLDHVHKIMHEKVMIVDGVQTLTGSYNWTTAAELENAEDLVVITDQQTAAAYAANFALHRAHSVAWHP